MLCCGWLVFNSCDWCISILTVPVSLSGPLFRSSPVVVFLDRGQPCFWNFNSTIPVDVVRVKSYLNCLFDPACVPMRITINKLYLILKLVLSVRCCERALKWRRSGYGRVGCLGRPHRLMKTTSMQYAVCSRNVVTHILSEYIVRQTIILYYYYHFTTMNNSNLFHDNI